MMVKEEITWRYSDIEILLGALESINTDIDERMSELREQNRTLHESMSGDSKEAFYDSYLKMHSKMFKVRNEMEILIKKCREGKTLIKKGDEEIANKIRQRWDRLND